MAGQGRGDDRSPFVGLPGSWQGAGARAGLRDEGPGSARSGLGFGFGTEDDGATRLVRPYTVTGGRTQPRYQLAIEALVTATVLEPRDLSVLAPECQAILQFCRDWRSVAEVSAVLRLPLGVARILIADMSADGLVRIHQRDDSEGRPDLHLLERVLSGLRKIERRPAQVRRSRHDVGQDRGGWWIRRRQNDLRGLGLGNHAADHRGRDDRGQHRRR